MNILVCVKQVPDIAEMKSIPAAGKPVGEGTTPRIVNTLDGYALEFAVRLKDADPAVKVVAVSMGPEQARAALKNCLSVGADKAYLVSDAALDESDTLATSYVLSRAVRLIEEREGAPFDLIFCGKQALDGDTAQVGPQLAEQLDYPQLTNAVELTVAGGSVRIKRETEDGFEIREAKCPAVVTISKPDFEPRYASVKSKMAANRAEIPTLAAADLNLDASRIGLAGSPTKVEKTFVPERKKGGVKIKEETMEESATKLAGMLSAAGIV